MDISSYLISTLTTNYLLVAARLFGVIITAPFFNSASVPTKIKIVLILLLSFLIAPQLPPQPAIEVFHIEIGFRALTQFCIGAIIGFIMQLTFQIITFSGQVLALQCGLGYATLVDPNTNDTLPIISQFYLMLTLFIFVLINGHLMLLAVLINSFTLFPLHDLFPSHKVESILVYSGQLFSGGVSIALPGIISLLTVNLTFAVMSRSAPQLNIMGIGFIIILILGLGVIAITIPNLLNHSQGVIENGLTTINGFVQ